MPGTICFPSLKEAILSFLHKFKSSNIDVHIHAKAFNENSHYENKSV